MDNNSKEFGAKEGAQTMLFYYLLALQQSEVKDPKQVIATELGKMIDLSEKQLQYVKSYLSTEGQLLESLSYSIQLLESIEKTGKLDLESISIVKQTLDIMYEEASDAVNKYVKFAPKEDDNNGNIKV